MIAIISRYSFFLLYGKIPYRYSKLQFDLLNAVCGKVVEQEPEAKKIISAALKEYTSGSSDGVTEDDILSALGYHISDFSGLTYGQNVLFMAMGFMMGISLFFCTFLYRNKMETIRIRALAEYLEQVNTGKAVILSTSGEDDFSKLEDEIYKTVTFLYQTKDSAVQAKNDFAENLSNIAHQIKTPITAISLSIQMMNHIACDLATNSEIVTPIFVHNEVVGVIDIDSPEPARFDHEDVVGLEEFAVILAGFMESEQ